MSLFYFKHWLFEPQIHPLNNAQLNLNQDKENQERKKKIQYKMSATLCAYGLLSQLESDFCVSDQTYNDLVQAKTFRA